MVRATISFLSNGGMMDFVSRKKSFRCQWVGDKHHGSQEERTALGTSPFSGAPLQSWDLAVHRCDCE